MARVAYIFREEHRPWGAMLLVRKLVFSTCFLIGQSFAGSIPVPTFLGGGQFDWRVLPFFAIVIYVLAQAQAHPYASKFDNVLEQTVLCMLIIVLYSELTLSPEMTRSDGVGVNMLVSVVCVVCVGAVWTHQLNARKKIKGITQLNLGSVMGTLAKKSASNGNDDAAADETAMPKAGLARLQSAISPNDPEGNDSDALDALDADEEKKKTKEEKKQQMSEDIENALKSGMDLQLEQIENFHDTFMAFDDDGSGTLSIDEFRKVVKLVGVDERKAEAMMAEVDQDGSGEIEFVEFLKVFSSEQRRIEAKEEIEEAFKIFQQDKTLGSHTKIDDEFRITATMLHAVLHSNAILSQCESAAEERELVREMLKRALLFEAADVQQAQKKNAKGALVDGAVVIEGGVEFSNPYDNIEDDEDAEEEKEEEVEYAAVSIGWEAFHKMMFAIKQAANKQDET